MTLEEKIARLFSMTEETWARHANPWSVWTRFTVLPLLVAAAWSRKWIGTWAWIPGVLALAWAWINPRVFARPSSTDNWASKAVLGERVWMNRRKILVPERYQIRTNAASVVAALSALVLAWGVWRLRIVPTIASLVMVYVGKIWFLDLMVSLYDEMKTASPEYERWLYRGE